MGSHDAPPQGPDFSQGVPAASIEEGRTFPGHVSGRAVLLSRLGGEVFAIGGTCSHYGGPLAEGACRKGVVRCPWHHAGFDLKSGQALDAPALAALDRFRTEVIGDVVFVREPLPVQPRSARPRPGGP
jgi:nitrite reductase/ring-hydroxylating ferredoxin subunit